MRIYWPRTKGNTPAILLMVATYLLPLLFTVDGFVSNPNELLLMYTDQVTHRRLFPTMQSRPSVKCDSKRDRLLETDTNDDEDYSTEVDENTERNKLQESSTQNSMPPQSLSIQAGVFATLLFVAFWPLLALLRSTTSPVDGFDVDMFMALKGIMDTTPLTDTDSTIVELPSLSPAEQLVGAIFGPPR